MNILCSYPRHSGAPVTVAVADRPQTGLICAACTALEAADDAARVVAEATEATTDQTRIGALVSKLATALNLTEDQVRRALRALVRRGA